MATRPIAACARPHIPARPQSLRHIRSQRQCICRCHGSRAFSSSARSSQRQGGYKDPFGTRLRKALADTKIKWYPIPVGLGIAFLGLGQLYRVNERERAKGLDDEWEDNGYWDNTQSGRDEANEGCRGRPKRRDRIRPTGPWLVSRGPPLYSS